MRLLPVTVGHASLTVGLAVMRRDMRLTRRQWHTVNRLRWHRYSVHIVSVTQEGIALILIKSKLGHTRLPLRVLPDGTYTHGGHPTVWKFKHRRTLWHNTK